jgi:hypothetical protein
MRTRASYLLAGRRACVIGRLFSCGGGCPALRLLAQAPAESRTAAGLPTGAEP